MVNRDDISYITILKPRELNYTESSRITTDVIVGLEANIDRDKWESRKEFLFQTLAFCLSLPNLWRFPKEALIGGQAAFVWLYIIFMLTIGSSLLFFEVALGQYSSKGFSKVFAMCPLFEGISYAMAFYCATVSTYYNMLNVYSFIYLFASFNRTLEYATCGTVPQNYCQVGTTNQSLTPEHAYFYHRIIYYSTDKFDATVGMFSPNWRNVGVSFFLWILICIVILRGIRTVKWICIEKQNNKFKLKMGNRDDISYITILKPRELNYTESSRITTDYIVELEANIDRDKWESRKEFLFQTLAFCLSLPNLWRFPKEALIGGQAAFVWLYIIFMLTIGSSLLFFEVALGQYSSKGFSKVFAMCPLFEGISYAMAFYCATVSTYYNMLNVYSFIYLFASFNRTLEYATCGVVPQNYCQVGTTNQSLTPEYAYFYHRIIYYSTDKFDDTVGMFSPNWRNAGVSFFLWILICIVILRGIRTVKWPAMVYCPIPYIALIFALISSLTLKGAKTGLWAMFSIHFKDLLNVDIWRRAFEQSVIALGLGMGPLITLGSYSKFQSPADRDSFVLCIFTLVGSLLSGAVIFTSAGIIALERNETMNTVFKEEGEYPMDLSVHVVFSQLFSRLQPGVGHVVSFVFYFAFLLAGWYSLITYTETFIVSSYTFFPTSHKHKIYTNLGLCICCYILGATLASRAGYNIMMSLDRFLVAMGLVVIIFCELIAVIYIYGIHDFSDDIDFMLGFYPNIYSQSIWIFSPFILVIVFCEFIYFCSSKTWTEYDTYTIMIATFTIIVPILLVGLHNVWVSVRNGNIADVLCPREVILLDDIDFIPSANTERAIPWFRKGGDTAGPSRSKAADTASGRFKP